MDLVTVTLHITQLIDNRVMWKTNHHSGHSILVLRPVASIVTILSKKQFHQTRTMTSYQRRDNADGLAPHFFKINMPESLEEGKLVSIP